MKEANFSWQIFEEVPIVGIIRGMAAAEVEKIVPAAISARLQTIEITMNTPKATDIIRGLATRFAGQLNVGAGTVCSAQDWHHAVSAGAQFIVTPVLSEEVIRLSVKAGIPVFPGAFTPTEIYRAWSLGAAMVKVYPASLLGPKYIKDIKAPLGEIRLMPTGGIDASNLQQYVEAGADGLGVGGHLFPKQLTEKDDSLALENHFKTFTKHFVDKLSESESANAKKN